MPGNILYAIFIGFVSGIAFRSFFDFGLAFAGFLAALALTLALYIKKISRNQNLNRNMALAAVFLAAAAFGVLRFDLAELPNKTDALAEFLESEIAIEGLIVNEPDEREKTVHLTIRPEKLEQPTAKKISASNGKILAIISLYPTFHYGDKVRLRGTLRESRNFETYTGRIVNYVEYLAKDGVYYQMFYPRVEILARGEGSAIKHALFNIKAKFLANIQKFIPEPHAALLGGLLVGARQSLGTDLLEKFRTVGLIHIVVLSGYNLTIVSDATARLFQKFFRRGTSVAVGAVSIILFTIMVGAHATAARAAIMALIALFARATGRIYDITRALLFAGFFMILQNPRIVVFDPSFELSFMATLALVALAPSLTPIFKRVPPAFGLRDIAVATTSTQIFVMPLLLYMSGKFSIVALPVNLLVLPVIAPTMLFGFLAAVAAFLSPVLAAPVAWIAYGLLSYMLALTNISASLPFASISIGSFQAGAMALCYVFIVTVLFLIKRNPVDNKNTKCERSQTHVS